MCRFFGEEELVGGVHALVGRSAQVLCKIQVQEGVEKVRQEVREIESEVNGEISGEERRSYHG